MLPSSNETGPNRTPMHLVSCIRAWLGQLNHFSDTEKNIMAAVTWLYFKGHHEQATDKSHLTVPQ